MKFSSLHAEDVNTFKTMKLKTKVCTEQREFTSN